MQGHKNQHERCIAYASLYVVHPEQAIQRHRADSMGRGEGVITYWARCSRVIASFKTREGWLRNTEYTKVTAL